MVSPESASDQYLIFGIWPTLFLNFWWALLIAIAIMTIMGIMRRKRKQSAPEVSGRGRCQREGRSRRSRGMRGGTGSHLPGKHAGHKAPFQNGDADKDRHNQDDHNNHGVRFS